jgi:hypothetical protein
MDFQCVNVAPSLRESCSSALCGHFLSRAYHGDAGNVCGEPGELLISIPG